MQMLKPQPQRSLPRFRDVIKRSSDEITRSWIEAVREDGSIPSAAGLEEPLLLDAVPLVLDEILRVIELDDSKIEHEKICSAARHGRERAREHFDVKELVREYQLLREHIFLYLSDASRFARFELVNTSVICQRVGAALDIATRETIHAFVEEHEVQLRRLSRTDSLTGLYNHRIFYERLADELNRARRYDSPLAIVFIDLDNFKSVNDVKGHQFGDQLLIKCAERLREDLRQTDIISRYGGEDFKELGRKEKAPADFGMSFGLSAHPDDDGTVSHMVKLADDRLRLNKQENKVGVPIKVAML